MRSKYVGGNNGSEATTILSIVCPKQSSASQTSLQTFLFNKQTKTNTKTNKQKQTKKHTHNIMLTYSKRRSFSWHKHIPIEMVNNWNDNHGSEE
jgi:hypothetical protein